MTVDLSAIAKWPNVPACYDWLSLDRRGNWRLQGERVTHRGLIEFMNRQYGSDESGCWFVQNGPQRVFVSLAYTPWVLRREGDAFVTHNGQPVDPANAVTTTAVSTMQGTATCRRRRQRKASQHSRMSTRQTMAA